MNELILGDCREVLKDIADNSIDAIVTDPPYGLEFMGKDWDKFGACTDSDVQEGTDKSHPFRNSAKRVRYGKKTDGLQEFLTPIFAECLRVLKPGGHMLAFGGSRTYHRLASAVEDAGFEIRDQIMWIQGSGFPKSQNVSKAIDKAGGVSPESQATMLRQKREAAGMTRDEVAAAVGCTVASVRDWEEGRARARGKSVEYITPSDTYREALANLLGYTHDERQKIGLSVDRRGDGSVMGLGHSGELTSGGHTPASKQWEGWGTALKPAHEPIVVARKPLKGTVANNVLTYGTGAINIDGCRVPINSPDDSTVRKRGDSTGTSTGWSSVKRSPIGGSDTGRWPANVIHDGSEEVLAAFPVTKSGSGNKRKKPHQTNSMAGTLNMLGREEVSYGDEGSAARFFYCAKASKKDRNENCEGVMTWDSVDLNPDLEELNQLVRGISEDTMLLLVDTEWSTPSSGRTITDPFPTDTMFIIETVSKLITELKTLNSSQPSNTRDFILDATRTLVASGLNLAESAALISHWTQNSTDERTESALGVVSAALTTLSKISGKGKLGNIHSTVKPTELMRYLIRLVTPPGGVVLDPFMGSGSTGKAARLEGFDFIGIEENLEYFEIAVGRAS